MDTELIKIRHYIAVLFDQGYKCNHTFFITKIFLETIQKKSSEELITKLHEKGIHCDCELFKSVVEE